MVVLCNVLLSSKILPLLLITVFFFFFKYGTLCLSVQIFLAVKAEAKGYL